MAPFAYYNGSLCPEVEMLRLMDKDSCHLGSVGVVLAVTRPAGVVLPAALPAATLRFFGELTMFITSNINSLSGRQSNFPLLPLLPNACAYILLKKNTRKMTRRMLCIMGRA